SQHRTALRQLTESVESIVKRVSPSVVQIVVTGLNEVDDHGRKDSDLVVERRRSVASGVIVESNGYVVTNAHALKGAQRVEVILPRQHGVDHHGDSHAESRAETLEARVAGMAPDMDLALLCSPSAALRACATPSRWES